MKAITKEYNRTLLKPREITSHKGSFGHALLVAGNTGRMGAAVIAARACLRAGVGLLTVNVPQDERLILQTTIPEAMLSFRENTDYDSTTFTALGIGPAMGTDLKSEAILLDVLTNFTKPIVLDADALNIISANKTLLKNIPKDTILTPHPKEFDRLFGVHQNTEDRINTAILKAMQYEIIIVLKGHQTCIINGEEVWINTTGNAGLAKGGSGDALTGIITAFLAQGYAPFIAAKMGVYLHGLAADITLKNQSMESMLISDVIENFGKAFEFVLK